MDTMENRRSNFHTHVQRCGHAGGTEEDYVKAAVANGFALLGFSDHGPFPDIDFGLRMPFSELREYLDAVEDVKTRYRSEITIWTGLEIEYLPEYRNYYEELLTKWDVDYLLMGEHFYQNAEGRTANVYEAVPSTEPYLFYARTIAEGMKTGYFKAIAHPDIYTLNPFAWDINCAKAADLIIDTAVATGTVLEYNANGFRRPAADFPDGLRHPYPHAAFWEMAAKAPVNVMIGSDCHNPMNLWDDAMDLSYQNIQEIGIEPIINLMNIR